MEPSSILFPHEKIRSGQKELVEDVRSALNKGHNLLAHAPTGIGKTAATLGPSLRYAMKNGMTVFFLTPKHTQHKIAVDTLQQIKQKYDLDFVATDFIGKKWMCPITVTDKFSSSEFQEYCKDLRDEERCEYYNNVWGKKFQLKNDADRVIRQIKKRSPIHSEELVKVARQEDMCGYELASLLAKKSQVIIADYYHLFLPSVRDAFLTRINKKLENAIIIVDEAHNLPGRVRDILSERMTTYTLRSSAKEARAFGFRDLSVCIDDVKSNFKKLANMKLGKKYEAYLDKEDIKKIIKDAGWSFREFMDEVELVASKVRKDKKRSYCSGLHRFLKAWKGPDRGYTRIVKKRRSKKSGKKYYEVLYSCLSPDRGTADVIAESHSTIAMSGTLTPLGMYQDLLGFEPKTTKQSRYKSPFPNKNQLALVVPETTTKYSARNEKQYQEIAKNCVAIIKNIPNNKAIFFPSYAILNSVAGKIKPAVSDAVFVEQQGLSKAKREEMLKTFKACHEKGALLMGVAGGSFAEGIDLPGSYLKAVIVVGVPLGHPDLETKALIDYYDYKFDKGWDYGYSYPAMTKVLQAAGRCIRSERDRGALVFLDKRFAWNNYLKCIPPEWNTIVTKRADYRIKKFFGK